MATIPSNDPLFQGARGSVTGSCVLCNQEIQHDAGSVLHTSAEVRCAYGTCEACRLSHITVEIGDGGSKNSVSIMTDWKQEEVQSFWSRETLSPNDVLMIHESLQSSAFELHCVESFNQ